MMQINVTNRIMRLRLIRYMDRQFTVHERWIYSKVTMFLRRTYSRAAKLFNREEDWEAAVKDNRALYIFLFNFYRRVFYSFSKMVFDSVDALADAEKGKYVEISEMMQKGIRDVFWNHFRNYIQSYCAQRVVDIAKTTRKKISRIIENGMRDEVGRQEITKRLMALSEINSKIRARMIAATETHSGASMAIHQAAKQERVLQFHEWATAHDERVRRSHALADGQKIPIDQPFIVSGEMLMYPGDPVGSAANIIRCRCVELFHTVMGRRYR